MSSHPQHCGLRLIDFNLPSHSYSDLDLHNDLAVLDKLTDRGINHCPDGNFFECSHINRTCFKLADSVFYIAYVQPTNDLYDCSP